MKFLLYTTSRGLWVQDECDALSRKLSATKGRQVEIVVQHKIPKKPKLIVDKDNDNRFSWDWFSSEFTPQGYDGVGFHFTNFYRERWRVKSGRKGFVLNGSRNHYNNNYPEFWFIADNQEMANGYDALSQFQRLFFHELAHFDENLDDNNGNLLTQNSVHYFDYKLKQIHRYHLFVDYRFYTFQQQMKQLVSDIIKLAKYVLK